MAIALIGALLAIVTPGQAQAQNAVLTGKVTSDFGQAIEGANVYINDLAISVGTNAEGNYTITIPAARVNGQQVNLRVRSVGYAPQVRPVRVTAGTQTFNFTMKQDVNRLDEIVVTGTIEGTERAKVPFAVARLSQEDLPVPALDPLRQLAGKVAGVRIAQTSGRPGSTPEIMMRGPTSINATDGNGLGRSRSPLIIVDGAIMNVGSLEEIGALDIESVEVVKGAAGASLYGTRAANGVITIKTKRGSNTDGVKFNVRTEYGFSDLNSLNYGQPVNHQLQLDETGKRFCVAGTGNVADCSQTFDWMTEIARINNVNADTTRTPQNSMFAGPGTVALQNVYQSQIWPGKYYNMLAQIVTQNPFALTAVDATGKVSGVRYFVSGSYSTEQGAIKNMTGLQERRARVNLDYDARRDLLISVSSMYDQGHRDLRNAGSNIFGQALRGAAAGTDYTFRDTLGRMLVRGGGGSLRSPTGNGGGSLLYFASDGNLNSDRSTYRFLGNITSQYFPKDWVTVEGTFAYDNRYRYDRFWETKGFRTQNLSPSDNQGQIDLSNRQDWSYNASLTSTFRKQLRSDLNGKLQFRGLYDEENLTNNGASGEQFIVKDVYTTTNTTANKDATSSSQTVRNVGYFTGASLDYKDRYIVDGTFRYDGSSLFGSGNRWAPFGRISFIWRVSEESFWTVPVMSDFRIRASHGTAGSTPRFSAQYETYNLAATGPSLGQLGNKKLKPETTRETEIGTDFTLWNRLGIELTNARSDTKNQILLVNTPASLGFSQQWKNAGTLSNNTWELALNLPVINNRDLSWSMRGTWDRTRTYITELFAPEYVQDAGTAQGTGNFFRITASRDKSNGFQQNRFGNVWGRKFYTSCGELPASVQPSCGPGLDYQRNDEGYIVWVGAGNDPSQGITNNLWDTSLPAASSPWNMQLFWGMPIVDRPLRGQPGEGVGIQQVIGNVFPDFRFSYGNNVQYKKFTFYALLDGTIGQDIYNQGEGWGLLDVSSSHFDQANKSVQTAKPMGYSWRAGPPESTGIGGFYDVLGPNNYVLEDGSYAKIREMSLSYKVGPVRGVGDWTFGVIARNLWTFTGYSGLDPEVGCGADLGGACGGGGSSTNGSGSGLINQVDAFGFPTLRTFTLTLSTRF